MLLEAEGVWDQTIAHVKRALLQRLAGLRGPVTMSDMWTRRTLLAMGDEPCPVTDEEAAEWLATRRVEAERTEESARRARVPVARTDKEGEGSLF